MRALDDLPDLPARGEPDARSTSPSSSAASVLDRWRDHLHESTKVTPADPWARRLPIGTRGIAALVAVLVVAIVGVGVLVLVAPGSEHVAASEPMPRSSKGTDAAPGSAPPSAAAPGSGSTVRPPGTPPAALVVHAAGAVANPGLYRLPTGARVSDLLEVAGGLRADADGDRLNLAAQLTDGARLYVPHRGEAGSPAVVGPDGVGAGSPGAVAEGADGGAASTSAPVNVNTATASELESLPGIGPATAASIIEYRTQHGPFRTADDLTKVRGIGQAKLSDLRARVVT